MSKKSKPAEKLMQKFLQDYVNKKKHLQPFLRNAVAEAWQDGYIQAMNLVAEMEKAKAQIEAQNLMNSSAPNVGVEKA